MTRTIALLATLLTLSAASLGGQEVCPCVTPASIWTVTACPTWNCAASAFVLTNGDRYSLVVPTTSNDYTWLVVKRVPAGSHTEDPDAPFALAAYPTLGEAIGRYGLIAASLTPMLITTPDGQFVVINRNQVEAEQGGRRRVVR
jgi:hypothetical protein